MQVVGLGCMRLTDVDGLATLRAALDAGVTIFDTARAYPDNEKLLARALPRNVRIVTKGGMRRPNGAWVPDGRARSIREDCLASKDALGALPIDLYLLHAPDPRVSWEVTVRALARLVDDGLVHRIGLSNVTRRQLDEALAIAPISAVQVAVGPFSDVALRGGVVARCIELGIEVLAHSPLGGPTKASKLSGHPELASIAKRHGVTAQRVALAAIADLGMMPLVGARRPETLLASTAPLELDDADRAVLERRYGWRAILSPVSSPATDAEVVLVMGVQGSGKSSTEWPGFERLNRDERGGTLKKLHRALDARLAAGTKKLVLDNTYTTRASRQGAIEVARRHGASVRGVWLDTPVAEAQRNIILRMLQEHGRLLEPCPLPPNALHRTLRDLEKPSKDEGFTSLELVPFVRKPRPAQDRVAEFIALEAAEKGVRPTGGLSLVFGWRPGGAPGAPGVRLCTHPGGPPRCWCRPPLPGLLLEFAEKNAVDLSRSVLIGTKPLHATMARALGTSYRAVGLETQR